MIDCQLSEDLQRDIMKMTGHKSKEGISSRALRFDDHGSLHVIGYDSEGKKIDDCALRNTNLVVVPDSNALDKSLEEHKVMTEHSKALNKLANAILIGLVAVALCILVVSLKY